MPTRLLLLLLIFLHRGVLGQGVHIGDGPGAPNPAAILDLDSESRGLLPPRLSAAQRDAILNPPAGLRIFNTDSSCENYFNGTAWFELCGICTPMPTIASAGADQLNIPDVTITTLTGNSPLVGTGTWTIVAGNGGSFSNTNSSNTTFSGLQDVVYTLRWTISNACNATSDDVLISFASCGSFTCGCMLMDARDNKIYPTVQIGSQCWMAANLNYGTRADAGISQPTSGESGRKWCGQNLESTCTTYGGHYQWASAMGGSSSTTANPSTVNGVCPAGWHLPSLAEWNTLAAHLGGGSVAGGPMKSITGWNNPNTGATNSSGFTGLPGGTMAGTTTYNIGAFGCFWTATETSGSSANRQCLAYNSILLEASGIGKSETTSVRCVMD